MCAKRVAYGTKELQLRVRTGTMQALMCVSLCRVFFFLGQTFRDSLAVVEPTARHGDVAEDFVEGCYRRLTVIIFQCIILYTLILC